jgi:pyridoxine kinase
LTARLLSDVKIEDMNTLTKAIEVIHERYHMPHIIITSVSLRHPDHPPNSLCVVGSSMTTSRSARPFKIVFPAFDAYFSGTGDMFAALTVVRMREAVLKVPGLAETQSWLSDDTVVALDLPLARATEMVLATMHEVLEKTCEHMTQEMKQATQHILDSTEDGSKKLHLLQSRAAELRLVRNLDAIRSPKMELRATKI